jgi:hypothetical protein
MSSPPSLNETTLSSLTPETTPYDVNKNLFHPKSPVIWILIMFSLTDLNEIVPSNLF